MPYSPNPTTAPVLAVVIVTFNSRDVILDCLESLMAADNSPTRIIIVDNASSDGTIEAIETWARGTIPYSPANDAPIALSPCPKPVPFAHINDPSSPFLRPKPLSIIRAKTNRGFAAGVNLGLALAVKNPNLQHFWILNPDSIATGETPSRYIAAATVSPGYGIMSGRTCYMEQPNLIQTDGGTVNLWTGVTGNLNHKQPQSRTPPATMNDIQFFTGANLLVSRAFYEIIGPMREDYFLYYEEVDWAFRRNSFSLHYCPGTLVYHQVGASIGSAASNSIGTPYSLYFKYRSRMRFVLRFHPQTIFLAYLYAMAKSAQMLFSGLWREAWAINCALHNGKAPKYTQPKRKK